MTEEKNRILLCEDDVNLGTLIREVLEAKGFDITLCVDGEAGYNAFLKNKFDFCVLDVMMPKKDGFELAKDIRQYNSTIPIMFLTAKTLSEDVQEGFKIGADDYMRKPFSMEELKSRIDAILRRTQSGKKRDLVVHTIGKYTFDTQKQILTYPDNDTDPEIMKSNGLLGKEIKEETILLVAPSLHPMVLKKVLLIDISKGIKEETIESLAQYIKPSTLNKLQRDGINEETIAEVLGPDADTATVKLVILLLKWFKWTPTLYYQDPDAEQIIRWERKLTTKESELLGLLCAHSNELLQRDYALKAIWVDDNFFNARSMDVYITKLRKLLAADENVQIINIHSKGYKLVMPEKD